MVERSFGAKVKIRSGVGDEQTLLALFGHRRAGVDF
jgi:hypothetical protein